MIIEETSKGVSNSSGTTYLRDLIKNTFNQVSNNSDNLMIDNSL